ncbi:helix-turn-helix transcriptional regulator [Actinoplanes oblitus]|uniref:Helix-turn-helix transcriptional regulator n=1 Tax=Actinoplanes oblitus TaxID=3040509 RepID=A0ABY8WIL2_9ACTN|nr:helix-turn-helix transcriptional regulator [Actinoplanes oblitus]WIM97716.1 helix-turn-helix transcriptional regulator [Actinoplanes oblitus]
MESFGQAARRLRAGLSLREIARRAHVDPGHLSRIEADKRTPTPQLAAALDAALGGAGHLAELARRACVEPWPLDGGPWRPCDTERLVDALAQQTPTAENAVELAHQWLIAEPPQLLEVRSGRRIGAGTVERVERRVQQLRVLDDYVGGGETWVMVTRELTATAGLLKGAAYTEDVGRRLLVAIGELCQVAGWVLSDSGRLAEAERVYLAGVRAANAGGDVAGAANNLSSLAYQLANTGDPRTAPTLARSAYAGARHHASATTLALLAERVAWAYARTGEARGAERALGQVEAEYDQRRPEDDPVWVYWLDQGEIEIMAGRVWTQLHRPLRAVPILERATSGYSDATGRETALYLSWLAESLIQANEVDRAAETASRAFRLSRQANSARAEDRIRLLGNQLGRFRGNAVVDSFLDEFRSAA